MVMVKCSELCQAAEKAGEVLRLMWMLQGAQLSEHIQHRLLKSLHSLVVPHVGPICRSTGFNNKACHAICVPEV